MKFQTLQNITENIRSDIFRLEEAIYLLEFIGKNAEDINKKYGILFGRIQFILEEYIINLLSKIFEKPKNYPLNSIPALKKLTIILALQKKLEVTLRIGETKFLIIMRGLTIIKLILKMSSYMKRRNY